MAELSEQETLYPSSTYFQYSNLGMTLLGEVVKELSGMPFESYIQMHILDPLDLQNTRTFLPEDQHGTTLATGYNALDRKGERERVRLFQARGINAAAGFSSNVLDLGKFASWQFRLMDTTSTEILRPSTLKYMQNVHWTDPDWKTTWGLGFVISKSKSGEKQVGHSGHCPGYNTLFTLLPDKKRAYAVFTNGNNTDRARYVQGMHSLLDKYKKAAAMESGSPDKVPDLDEFEGYYRMMPWVREMYVSSWRDRLVLLSLPSDDPAESLIELKYTGEDTFRRLRDDGKLAEAYEFERDNQGTILEFKSHNNYYSRIPD